MSNSQSGLFDQFEQSDCSQRHSTTVSINCTTALKTERRQPQLDGPHVIALELDGSTDPLLDVIRFDGGKARVQLLQERVHVAGNLLDPGRHFGPVLAANRLATPEEQGCDNETKDRGETRLSATYLYVPRSAGVVLTESRCTRARIRRRRSACSWSAGFGTGTSGSVGIDRRAERTTRLSGAPAQTLWGTLALAMGAPV